jgi:hypothetical protein
VYPVASPLARHQAAAGPYVTNLRHETVSLSEWHRRVLCLLDGCNTRTDLLERLAAPNGRAERGPSNAALDRCLADLARDALLGVG